MTTECFMSIIRSFIYGTKFKLYQFLFSIPREFDFKNSDCVSAKITKHPCPAIAMTAPSVFTPERQITQYTFFSTWHFHLYIACQWVLPKAIRTRKTQMPYNQYILPFVSLVSLLLSLFASGHFHFSIISLNTMFVLRTKTVLLPSQPSKPWVNRALCASIKISIGSYLYVCCMFACFPDSVGSFFYMNLNYPEAVETVASLRHLAGSFFASICLVATPVVTRYMPSTHPPAEPTF